MKFTEFDEKLKQLAERRNVSKSRRRGYNRVFTEIYNLTGKTPSELIKEAKKEQQPFIDENGIPRILEIDDRKIAKYQYQYINHLNNSNITESTKKMNLAVFRCLFNEYDVILPKNYKFNSVNYRIRRKQLPTLNDVKESLKFCKTSRDKAIITFLVTSGIRESDVVSFTIKDFINATSIYHNGTLNDLLSKNPYHIIPLWDFYPINTRKKGNLCITFNTGECTHFILNILKTECIIIYQLL